MNGIAKVIEHLSAVQKMVGSGRDCREVLIQLSAVKYEIANVSKVILKDHFYHGITDEIKQNDKKNIMQLKEAIDKLL